MGLGDAVSIRRVQLHAGAGSDEGSDALSAFDPAVAFETVKSSADGGTTQAGHAGQLVIGKKARAGGGLIFEEVIEELFAQGNGRASGGEGCLDFKRRGHVSPCLHVTQWKH